jgi:hypothetical protein
MITLLSFLFTASIAFLNHKGNHKIPFAWHPKMAGVSIALAIIHSVLVMLHYF